MIDYRRFVGRRLRRMIDVDPAYSLDGRNDGWLHYDYVFKCPHDHDMLVRRSHFLTINSSDDYTATAILKMAIDVPELFNLDYFGILEPVTKPDIQTPTFDLNPGRGIPGKRMWFNPIRGEVNITLAKGTTHKHIEQFDLLLGIMESGC